MNIKEIKEKIDYPEHCNRNLPDEVEYLQKKGRTGVEGFIAQDSYQKRKLTEREELKKLI